MIIRGCELCNAEAAIYCASDSAFLCRSCDANVHEANFLVARHLRQTVCSQCKSVTGNFISGVGLKTLSVICSSRCSPSTGIDLNSDCLSSSSTSICVSSTTTLKKAYSDRRETYGFDLKLMEFHLRRRSKDVIGYLLVPLLSVHRNRLEFRLSVIFKHFDLCFKHHDSEESIFRSPETYGFDFTTSFNDNSCEFIPGKCMKNQRELNSIRSKYPSKVDWKTEGVLVNWSRKLGLPNNESVRVACDALRACLDQWTTLPFRVCLAASMWLGLGFCGNRLALTWQALKKLAEMSGVPAKLILVAQSKLHLLLKARRQNRRDHQFEEGWAECSA